MRPKRTPAAWRSRCDFALCIFAYAAGGQAPEEEEAERLEVQKKRRAKENARRLESRCLIPCRSVHAALPHAAGGQAPHGGRGGGRAPGGAEEAQD